MIISDTHQFLYIKTRKTAGTSIQTALGSCCGADDYIAGNSALHQNSWNRWWEYPIARAQSAMLGRNFWPHARKYSKHATISDVMSVIGGTCQESYLKIAFIRNPFDLVVSRFFWDGYKQRHDHSSFTSWVEQDYCQDDQWRADLLHSYTHINNVCHIDFIGRYENLNQDYHKLCELLGFSSYPGLSFQKAGFRPNGHYSTFYTPQSRAIIERLFSDDLRLFDYRFESL
ncbi:MAG: hypothetical protein DRQ56_08035 [Gammaproteobacteria bacterium]|nr:MAG: hypothetical protein DRQ56_08035 [Gammaproteobacteria bacterium]